MKDCYFSISMNYNGRMIRKTVTEQKHNKTKTNAHTYIYDNEDIILEYVSISGHEEEEVHHGHHGRRHNKHHKGRDSQYVIKYLHGPGIDEPLAIKQKGRVYYYHADGLGSITALTDERGKVVQRYKYDSFGNMKHRGHKIKQPYTFTGREWDKETGLYYYRARYYDPEVGRFISFDPILHPADGLHKNRTCGQNSNSSLTSPSFISLLHDTQTLNPYVYVKNLPTTKTDPSGLGPEECAYYDQVCQKTGGKCFYECKTVPIICRHPYLVPTFWSVSESKLKCIRTCLIREDMVARSNTGNLTKNCCMKDNVIDQYHKKCFMECKVATWRYPGVWPLGNGN